ncbi:MAG: DinB family protein [Mucilaginibacter sp.]
MKNDLPNEIEKTKKELLNALGQFDQGNINTIPFEGSWTGGQVAEHVLKSLSGALENLKGPTVPTERNPGEHVKQLGDVFLNMEIKMKSPDFILPSNTPKDKSMLMVSLEQTLERIKSAAVTDDLSVSCTTFEMPMIGPLTRLEWISFASFHTQRHANQLKNIIKTLKSSVQIN